MTLREVLESYGYSLKDDGRLHWRSSAIFRCGNNKTALRINKKSGAFSDFVEGSGGSFKTLISLTLGKKVSDEEFHKIITDNNVELEEDGDKEEIIMERTWEISELDKLIPNYSFYLNRGISKETLKDFYCGFADSGAMSGRMVFPCFREDGKIIGFNGRAVFKDKDGNEPAMKWKKIGPSKDFQSYLKPSRTAKVRKVFPCIEAMKETGDAIIVESIGDELAMAENGIKNIVVSYGTKLSSKNCSFIASMGLKRIIIALNNDKNGVGEEAAINFFIQLSSLVSYNKIVIHLPQNANDFGDMQKEGRGAEIEEWYKNCPAENTVEMKKKILARMRTLYKEKKLSTQAVKMAQEIKEEIEENE